MRWTKQETEAARESLREDLHEGQDVYCILRSRSRSGMQRTISLVVIGENGQPWDISYRAAKAIGWSYDDKREGIKVGGCGMDM